MKKEKIGDYIEIHAFWGSDFQRESGMEAIDAMLRAWVQFYTGKNKSNELFVTMSTHPAKKFPFVIKSRGKKK